MILSILSLHCFSREEAASFRLSREYSGPVLSPPMGDAAPDRGRMQADSPHENGDSEHPEVKPKVLRALLECASVLAISQTNYWLKYANWIEDWQFELTWADQKRRIFSTNALRFDSNWFSTNWGHAISGAVYYNFYRTNHFSWKKALLFNMFTSLYWEYLVEWREIISLNDNIFTGIGGFPLGEALFQSAGFFQSRGSGFARTIGKVLNPILWFNRWLDRKRNYPSPEFPWHRFRLYAGSRSGRDALGNTGKVFAEFGASLSLIKIPEFGAPARIRGWSPDVMATHLEVQFLTGSNGLEEFSGLARAMPFGWTEQNIVLRNGLPRGYSLLVGAAMAFEIYRERQTWEYDEKNPFYQPWNYDQIPLPTEYTDKFSAIHLMGPRLEWHRYRGDLHWNLAVEATLDFAMTGSLAINEYSRSNTLTHLKSTLANYGYYYSIGLSSSVEMNLVYRNLELGVWARGWFQKSIQGLDRFDEYIMDDISLKDSRVRLGMRVGYTIPRSPVQLSLVLEEVKRRGTLREITVTENDTRFSAHVNYRF